MIYDSPDYKEVHKLISEVRGGAWKYKCVNCEYHANEWSHIHESCPYDISNYEPRCYSCHRRYDRGHIQQKSNIIKPKKPDPPRRLYERRLPGRQRIVVKGLELQMPKGVVL